MTIKSVIISKKPNKSNKRALINGKTFVSVLSCCNENGQQKVPYSAKPKPAKKHTEQKGYTTKRGQKDC
jgi:hypothetical protein